MKKVPNFLSTTLKIHGWFIYCKSAQSALLSRKGAGLEMDNFTGQHPFTSTAIILAGQH